MSFCIWHNTLAMVCHGPHCPTCGAPDLSPCIEFHRRVQHAPAAASP